MLVSHRLVCVIQRKSSGGMSDPAHAKGDGKMRGRIAEDVYKQLASDIVTGQFEPGARLDEVMLASRFEVSRTPVREALKQLVISGLAVYRPNRGAVVASMTAERLDQMFEAIGDIEAACARHASLRMSDAERTELREIHAAGRAAMQTNDSQTYDRLNVDLHMLIIRGAHNAALAETACGLRDRIAPFRSSQFRHLERIGESFAEHSIIVDAILNHDALLAYREMRNHLMSARVAVTRPVTTPSALLLQTA
ncbi:GntR family transcriptional regulator [Herbaspirillum sp. RTI4]|uniref:GntR family transcriptional regulator n=1 Tax=Herbaspirillum sp. RTI4 TaxID=3048640 RepID=UPI002AB5128E|nr:GntR family transcriptional regulator [Herbaspirillum sp. RTI4]MDY7579425.1 GntR family transcriptional regulator [Herbaspirillum sp. RTI4]MEA9980339.1 GntR family transcriptional regulator [Herbaspirillum sp. RTI4]